jgi:hypothetical protein
MGRGGKSKFEVVVVGAEAMYVAIIVGGGAWLVWGLRTVAVHRMGSDASVSAFYILPHP